LKDILKDIVNMFISFILFILAFLIIWYRILVTDDMSVSFSLNELKGLIIVLLIYMVFQYIHINRTKSFIVNINNFALLLYPTTFWFIGLYSSLKHFHKYIIICDIIGFVSMIIILFFCLYKILSMHKKHRAK
jgi:hypothetical protein